MSSIVGSISEFFFEKPHKFLKRSVNPLLTSYFTIFNYVGAKKLIEENFPSGKEKEILILITTIVSFAYLLLYLFLAGCQIIFEGKEK